MVEDCIMKQLGGECHRCSFFRSVAYIRLRVAALYLNHCPKSIAHAAYCGDLSVSLTCTAEGPLVSVLCSYDPVYPDDFEARSSEEPRDDMQISQHRKRMRIESLE